MPEKIEAVYFVEPDAEALARRTAGYLMERIDEAAHARGRARVAISGGSTPRRTFELLAETPYRDGMPWDRLEIYWVDERCVPSDDKDSNYRMTWETLLSKVPLGPEQIFRIHGEIDPEQAAAEYESEIRRNFRLEGAQLPVFDVVSMGMGPDGHTASLFPHSAALHERMRIAVANHVPAQAQPWRVTLSAPVINAARDVSFLIAGADKAAPLKSVLLGAPDPETFPSQLIRPANGRLTFLLDPAAASQLPPPDAQGAGRVEIA